MSNKPHDLDFGQDAGQLTQQASNGRPAVPHGTNAHTVYEALRQRIGTSFYAPGSRLTEVEIAKEFGVSRTPVRQALHRLGAEGLVEVKNGVGVRVTEIADRELEDMYKLRLRLVEMDVVTGVGEVKRLYVRPERRGGGWGRKLAEAVVDDARAIGYRELKLDTLEWMAEARALYAKLGFRECPKYYDNPHSAVVYMSLEL